MGPGAQNKVYTLPKHLDEKVAHLHQDRREADEAFDEAARLYLRARSRTVQAGSLSVLTEGTPAFALLTREMVFGPLSNSGGLMYPVRYSAIATLCILLGGHAGIAGQKPARPNPKTAPIPEQTEKYVFPQSGDLTNTDLTHIGFKLAAFTPKDQFDSPPDTALLVGRTFLVELPASYTYDIAQHVLTFSIHPDGWSSLTLLSSNIADWHSIAGFKLDKKFQNARHYEASNAYGAKATVTETETDSVGIAHFARNYSFEGGTGLPDPKSSNRSSTEYIFSTPLDPDAARQMAKNTVLVVSGTIDKLTDGRSVVCGAHYLEATIDSPYEDFGTNCVVVVNIARIALIDKRSQTVLAEWR